MPRKASMQSLHNQAALAQQGRAHKHAITAQFSKTKNIIKMSSPDDANNSDCSVCCWDGSINHSPSTDGESDSDSAFSNSSDELDTNGSTSDCLLELDGWDLEQAGGVLDRRTAVIERLRQENKAEVKLLKELLAWDKITAKKTVKQWKRAEKSFAAAAAMKKEERDVITWKGHSASMMCSFFAPRAIPNSGSSQLPSSMATTTHPSSSASSPSYDSSPSHNYDTIFTGYLSDEEESDDDNENRLQFTAEECAESESNEFGPSDGSNGGQTTINPEATFCVRTVLAPKRCHLEVPACEMRKRAQQHQKHEFLDGYKALKKMILS
ncbi:hypothetical protein EDD18DRAFT_1363711 [Armillaria luteobubalina]|uniref:Uncharacterized protein n=1 Tax=Armillaria luteobubalina TaxID=153913 RepID=A0AA39PB65_9AGAR|nr:hypothetical protein EDD18DRAFT_1363711 [Armillaria luteobubalina]